jgi:uncharacterized damage-inducible protein DinB
MVDVRELIQYNQEVRHRYLDALAKLPWEELTKNREASFHSMRNIFIHTLNAIDYWLDILQRQEEHARKKFDEYKNIEDMREFMEKVESRMRSYMNALATEGLGAKYTVTNDANQTVEITVEDVLIHVFEEEVHHRGELIALLWQMDVEPPLMGWKYL